MDAISELKGQAKRAVLTFERRRAGEARLAEP
jgi:hypothetical protein